mmetsp:Transcript_6085/g.19486  ORF Transcript_6085/g.19486 Transcript_6085/m.19486 type:complete len:301 (+) Transcript_6085:195-1097(+)
MGIRRNAGIFRSVGVRSGGSRRGVHSSVRLAAREPGGQHEVRLLVGVLPDVVGRDALGEGPLFYDGLEPKLVELVVGHVATLHRRVIHGRGHDSAHVVREALGVGALRRTRLVGRQVLDVEAPPQRRGELEDGARRRLGVHGRDELERIPQNHGVHRAPCDKGARPKGQKVAVVCRRALREAANVTAADLLPLQKPVRRGPEVLGNGFAIDEDALERRCEVADDWPGPQVRLAEEARAERGGDVDGVEHRDVVGHNCVRRCTTFGAMLAAAHGDDYAEDAERAPRQRANARLDEAPAARR